MIRGGQRAPGKAAAEPRPHARHGLGIRQGRHELRARCRQDTAAPSRVPPLPSDERNPDGPGFPQDMWMVEDDAYRKPET